MPDFKEMSFMMFFLLVTVSGVYEWANSDPVLSKQLGVDFIDDFESSTMQAQVESMQVASTTLVSNIAALNFFNFLTSVAEFFGIVWVIFMKMMFGWANLIQAIFTAIGLVELAVVFIVPLSVMQLLGAFYFIRDIANTVRGVAGR